MKSWKVGDGGNSEKEIREIGRMEGIWKEDPNWSA
jgi:hypothetical protein